MQGSKSGRESAAIQRPPAPAALPLRPGTLKSKAPTPIGVDTLSKGAIPASMFSEFFGVKRAPQNRPLKASASLGSSIIRELDSKREQTNSKVSYENSTSIEVRLGTLLVKLNLASGTKLSRGCSSTMGSLLPSSHRNGVASRNSSL